MVIMLDMECFPSRGPPGSRGRVPAIYRIKDAIALYEYGLQCVSGYSANRMLVLVS
jgi:hypothetical protein